MKSPLRKNSFKRIIVITAMVIVALLLVSAIVNLMLVRSHYKNYENEQIQEQLENKALILGKQLRLFRQIIANVAAESNTRDILTFGEPNASHQ